MAVDDYCFALLGLAVLVWAPPGLVEAGEGVCGLAGAEPVVVPGWLLGARGVTSRMPGGAAGGEVDADFWAVAGAGAVAAFCWFLR